jgi:hypothetical protein
MKMKIVATIALIAGTSAQALAQGGGAPSAPAPGTVDSMAATRASREQQEGYNRIINNGVQVKIGQDEQDNERLARRKAPVPATAADVLAGAVVRDKNGVQIATIERLEQDGAVIRAGDRLAKLPLDALGKEDAGLLIAITAAEFQAAIAQTSVPVAQAEPEVVAATAADIAPGAAVRDSEGVQIGTVEQLVETGVILLTDGRKVKLAVDSFGKDENGLLIGITASEFKAMIGNSAPAPTGG